MIKKELERKRWKRARQDGNEQLTEIASVALRVPGVALVFLNPFNSFAN